MSYSEVGTWSGKPLFKCDDCVFQTASIPQRDKHDAEAHPRERAPLTKILDPDGKPFESIPVPSTPEVVPADAQTEAVLKQLGVGADEVAEAAAQEAAEQEAQEGQEDGSTSKAQPWWRRSPPDKETAS